MHIHQLPAAIEPGRAVLVAQPKAHREIRTDLPRVVDVVILIGRSKLDEPQPHHALRRAIQAEQIVRKTVTGARRSSRILRGLTVKHHLAARKLITNLVEPVPADFGAEPD